MTYLDTGCLVKLYYPEPESGRIIARVQGKVICYTPLHELEFLNALQLKVFSGGATAAQVKAARESVAADLAAGVLRSTGWEWPQIFQEAVRLAERHTDTLGCRSLDILHCATARIVGAAEFITTDTRQIKLAGRVALNLIVI